MRTITLRGFARDLTLSATDRTITGTITIYNAPSTTQRVIFHDGALTARQPLNRVKLLRDHDHTDPVGYMLALDAPVQVATFYVPEGENGDRALKEAVDGIRDGLSVGWHTNEYAFDDEGNFHVYDGELYEVSLCAIPDMTDAQVTEVVTTLAAARKEQNQPMNESQLRAALAAGSISQATFDAQLAALTPAPIPSEVAVGPETLAADVPRVTTQERPKSLHQLAVATAAAAQTGSIGAVTLALEGFIPADDAGQAFYGRSDWIGESWSASPQGRPWIDSFGTPKPLTSAKIEGFQWDVPPTPAKYAGNLAQVPTNKPKTKKVDATPERWAGGWTLDRIFTDLGSPELVTSFWNKAVEQYQLASDFDIAAKVVAAATVPLDGETPVVDTTVLGAIAATATSLRRIGATLDRIALAEDLFEAYAELKIADLPAWLANQLGFVNIKDGTSNIGELLIEADDKLADGELVGYDKRAATVYEKTPFQIQAVHVVNGGIDLGFFAYGGLLFNDKRAIVKRTVVLDPAE